MTTFLIIVYTKYTMERWVITDETEDAAVAKVKEYYGKSGSMTMEPKVTGIRCISLPWGVPAYIDLTTKEPGSPVV